MVFTATARWNFRGETWLAVELEAANIEAASAQLYSMLPITFFRGHNRLVSIRPQNLDSFEPKKLATAGHSQIKLLARAESL